MYKIYQLKELKFYNLNLLYFILNVEIYFFKIGAPITFYLY